MGCEGVYISRTCLHDDLIYFNGAVYCYAQFSQTHYNSTPVAAKDERVQLTSGPEGYKSSSCLSQQRIIINTIIGIFTFMGSISDWFQWFKSLKIQLIPAILILMRF